ncbi:hypothetical protein AB0K15_06210 [Amycolatopsis sp. NPDC049253]|uniref:hypothetical protein n=1 Tax=Amycolatopsis sp. NPDC049253 TaxID=3155274 RepID=UPI0034133343
MAERARATWDVAVTRLPVGARITGSVVARQPFGVFFAVDEVPGALALAEVTSLPGGGELPVLSARVTGEVLGHRHENHQIHVRVTRVD